MTFGLPVYLPNISTDKLIEILSKHLAVDTISVEFEKVLQGGGFRSPELVILLKSELVHPAIRIEKLLTQVIFTLISAARVLGATQFSIEKEGFDMRLRPITLDVQRIENLIIALGAFNIKQVNIF